MKKIIALFVIFVCVGAALSAQISVGGGGLFDLSIGNGARYSNSGDYHVWGSRILSFGAFGFVDFTYAELNVDFGYGLTISDYERSKYGDKTDSKSDSVSGEGALQLGISLLGKYPVNLGGGMTVYPLAGLGYNIVLATYSDGDKEDWGDESAAGELSQFYLSAGGGLDYDINRNLYFRAQGLVNFRFAPKAARDGVKDATNFRTTMGIGPRIKLGIGYRF